MDIAACVVGKVVMLMIGAWSCCWGWGDCFVCPYDSLSWDEGNNHGEVKGKGGGVKR